MSVQTTTHLNFRGDAREALTFYQSVFGGHLVINTVRRFRDDGRDPRIRQGSLRLVAAENGFRMMGYDIPGLSEGGLAGGGATRRENGTTITEQAVFVSIRRADARGVAGLLGRSGG